LFTDVLGPDPSMGSLQHTEIDWSSLELDGFSEEPIQFASEKLLQLEPQASARVSGSLGSHPPRSLDQDPEHRTKETQEAAKKNWVGRWKSIFS
jgi:hypothetical protein